MSEASIQVDDEITEWKLTLCKPQAQINALCTQRNALSFVSRLPPEILSIIFVQYAQTHLKSDKVDSTQVPGWVNVSYVCRHWRNVALNCPTLWAHIFLTSRSWMDELLSRSKTAPLKIRSTVFASGSPGHGREVRRIKHLKHVLTHMERVQDLKIFVSFEDREEVLSMFASPAPLLQSLVLSIGDCRRISSFFNGIAPALHRLELFSCSMPLPPPTLPSLTTLILYRSQHTMDEIKAVLCSSQNLVHLEVLGFLDTTLVKHDSHPSEVFRPPHLLRLAITEISCSVIQLLSWLDIPSRTDVRIGVSSLHPETWMTLHSLIAQRLYKSEDDSLTPSSIRTLAVDVNSGGVTFTVFRGDNQGSSPLASNWDCDIPLELSLFGVLEHEWVRDILQDMLHHEFFADLESSTLTVDGSEGSCSTVLEDILSLTPQLRYIKMINGGTTDLRTLFSLLSHAPSDTPPHPVEDQEQTTLVDQPSLTILAPFLKRLDFSECLFDHRFAPERRAGRVWDLREALDARRVEGHFVDRLTFTACRNVVEEDVGELDGFVNEVIWDKDEDELSIYSTEDEDEYD